MWGVGCRVYLRCKVLGLGVRGAGCISSVQSSRKVYVRLTGKGDSNSHGARPVHMIVIMINWSWTRRLSTKKSLSGGLE